MTMMGGIALDGFRAFTSIDAASSGEVFAAFVEEELAPDLQPDDIVVMDHLSAHDSAPALEAIRRVGGRGPFPATLLAGVQPDRESQAQGIRTAATDPDAVLTREAFESAVAQAMDAITLQDIRAWTAFAGYSIGFGQ